MEKIIVLVMSLAISCWAVPKPMESLTNYNVLLLHGAYGSNKGFLNVTDADRIDEAYKAAKPSTMEQTSVGTLRILMRIILA